MLILITGIWENKIKYTAKSNTSSSETHGWLLSTHPKGDYMYLLSPLHVHCTILSPLHVIWSREITYMRPTGDYIYLLSPLHVHCTILSPLHVIWSREITYMRPTGDYIYLLSPLHVHCTILSPFHVILSREITYMRPTGDYIYLLSPLLTYMYDLVKWNNFVKTQRRLQRLYYLPYMYFGQGKQLTQILK